ncbi:MAG: SMC family ATPase [bacterium]|nr:SMC family ATPase [bacterium]
MLPIRLEIKNFLAYRSPEPLRFEGIHLACLTGANGAGKSSLLDAITWALWGEARTRRAEDLIHMNQSDMVVALEFEQEGILYKVVRRRSRKSSSGTLDLLTHQEDGSWISHSNDQVKAATQAQINQLLRMDYDTFVNSAFLQQGKADSFTTKPPRERKQILADILGLARWEDYETQAKDAIKGIEQTIIAQESSIRDLIEQISREPQFQTQLAEAEIAQQEAAAALEVAEEHYRAVQNAPNDLRAKQGERARIEANVRNYESERGALETERARKLARVQDYEALIDQRNEIEAGYQLLRAAREDDQALGTKLRQLSDYDSQRHALDMEIAAEGETLRREAAVLESRIETLTRIIAAAHPDDLAEARLELEKLEAADLLREQYTTEVAELRSESTGLAATNKELHREMKTLDDRRKRLESHADATCPYCGQPLDHATRLRLVDEIAAEGTPRGDQYRGNKVRIDEIEQVTAAHKREIDALALQVRKLDALREHTARLQKSVDDAHEAALDLNEAEARYAVVRDLIDREAYALDVRAALAELDVLRAAVGYDSDRHTAAQQQLQMYLDFEARQTRLNLAAESLPAERDSLAMLEQRIDRLTEAMRAETAALEQVEIEIVRLRVLVEEERARREEVLRLRTAERSASEKVIIAQQHLKAIDDARVRKAELEARVQAAREDKVVYEELKTAFGKNGIPAMIIETAIPELEASANALLGRMTDGRMSLAIPTQRDKVTGGVAETLDIVIADELGTRGYELFSGGEAFRINFALRVALSQLLARRAGAHLRTLFIDEGFGTQDEDGRNKLIEAITAVQDGFDMILVITHIDDLRDSFPVHIAIDKTSDGSRISVR